jgi:ATP-dependent DNA ligase
MGRSFSRLLTRAGRSGVEKAGEVSYVEMTPDGLLRHIVYLREREDKPARDVRRERPHYRSPAIAGTWRSLN